jgi:hypothetical protein
MTCCGNRDTHNKKTGGLEVGTQVLYSKVSGYVCTSNENNNKNNKTTSYLKDEQNQLLKHCVEYKPDTYF